MKLKAGLLFNALLRIRPLTFISEALHNSSSSFVASTASPYFSLAGIHDVLCYYGHAYPFYQWQVSYKVIKSREKPRNLFNQSRTAYITPYHATGY